MQSRSIAAQGRWGKRQVEGRRHRISSPVVAHGYGMRIKVSQRELVIEDGIADERRQRKFSKATARLRRLVILSHSGQLTLEAIRWLYDAGAAVIQVGADGQVLLSSAPAALDDAELRRKQALAGLSDLGLEIVKGLIAKKVERQIDNLRWLGLPVSSEMARALSALPVATDLNRIRELEARAAVSYWQGWEGIPVQWAKNDYKRIPEHWRQFAGRKSPITGIARNSATPINALLNYCYALLGAEARIVILAAGLDPGMGLLHLDDKGRDSLVYDVIEPARPLVDRWIINLLQEHVFTADDFFEKRDGGCRITHPLTEELARILPLINTWLQPAVADLVRALHRAPAHQGLTSPIHRTNSFQSFMSKVSESKVQKKARRKASQGKCCKRCGSAVRSERAYCPPCYQLELAVTRADRSREALAGLAEMRAMGVEPNLVPEVRKRIGMKNAARNREAQDWLENGGIMKSPSEFTNKILPHLVSFSLKELSEASGLSQPYCSRIRSGEHVPHPRHWERFRKLVHS